MSYNAALQTGLKNRPVSKSWASCSLVAQCLLRHTFFHFGETAKEIVFLCNFELATSPSSVRSCVRMRRQEIWCKWSERLKIVCLSTNDQELLTVCFSLFVPRTFDTLRNHPSFYLFNHRGRVLFRTPEEEPSSVHQQALPNPIRLRKLEHLHWDGPFLPGAPPQQGLVFVCRRETDCEFNFFQFNLTKLTCSSVHKVGTSISQHWLCQPFCFSRSFLCTYGKTALEA